MSKQQSNIKGAKSSLNKADSTRYGFEPIPPTTKVGGASSGNKPTRRTAAEVMDFYTEKKMKAGSDSPTGADTDPEPSQQID